MKEVIILSGVSGSGKSTHAHKLRTEKYAGKDVCIVSADHYFMVNGQYVFDLKSLGAAHGQCLRNYTQALTGNMQVVIVDNTNTTLLELAPYVALANAYKARCTLVTMDVDLDLAARRNEHGVTLKTIHTQAANLRRRVCPSYWDIEYVNVYSKV